MTSDPATPKPVADQTLEAQADPHRTIDAAIAEATAHLTPSQKAQTIRIASTLMRNRKAIQSVAESALAEPADDLNAAYQANQDAIKALFEAVQAMIDKKKTLAEVQPYVDQAKAAHRAFLRAGKIDN
jgi:hypothetical protein